MKEAASVEDPKELYEAQLACFLDPFDPEVIEKAKEAGINEEWITGLRIRLFTKWR